MIHKLSLPKRDQLHHYIIASDWHTYAVHEPTLNIMLKLARKLPKGNRRLIIAGDFLDALHIMPSQDHFKSWIKRANNIEEYFLPESEAEFAWGNTILDRLEKVFDKIYFILGNHDWRYDQFRDKHSPAAYTHNFDISTQLKLKSRGIEVIPFTHWLDIGHITITHGTKHGANHNKAMFQLAGKNVVYGHVHHANMTSFFFRGQQSKAYSLPCMSNLNPDYMFKLGGNNWENGFCSLTVKHNGNYQLHMHTVLDNQLILPDGKLISG